MSSHFSLWVSLFALMFGCVRTFCAGPLKRHVYIYDWLFHASTTAMGLAAMITNPAVTEDLWAPNVVSDDWRVAQLPAMNLGYYVITFFIILFTTRRLDMLAHHVVTAILITYAIRWGLLHAIMVTVTGHNVNDVFLLTGKILMYDGRPEWMSDAFMYVFVASWFYCRLYLLPRYILWSIIVDNAMKFNPPALYWTMVFITALLQLLQVHWTFLIVRLVYRKLTAGETRTDDDDDE